MNKFSWLKLTNYKQDQIKNRKTDRNYLNMNCSRAKKYFLQNHFYFFHFLIFFPHLDLHLIIISQSLFLIYDRRIYIWHSIMKESVNVTQTGRKYLQLHYNIVPPEVKERKDQLTLPSIKSQSKLQVREAQLHQLPYRLNRILKNSIIKQAQQQLQKSVKDLEIEMTKDLGYTNKYTKERARDLVKKMLKRSQKDEERVSVGMEVSKSRNYLSRINFLHSQKCAEYSNMKQSIQKMRNKQNTEERQRQR